MNYEAYKLTIYLIVPLPANQLFFLAATRIIMYLSKQIKNWITKNYDRSKSKLKYEFMITAYFLCHLCFVPMI